MEFAAVWEGEVDVLAVVIEKSHFVGFASSKELIPLLNDSAPLVRRLYQRGMVIVLETDDHLAVFVV